MMKHINLMPEPITNNILSGTKYRASPEGVSLMDETNNILSGTKFRASPEGVSLMDETNNVVIT
jgi:hypothetical protein